MPYSADGDTTWNGLRCSPVVDQPGQLGDPCTAPEGPTGGLDDCDVGLVCWGVTLEQTSGTCVEQCGGTPNAPTCSRPETVCSIYNDGVLTLCLPTCDPLDPACPEDQLCIPRPGGQSFVCAVDASPTTGAYGDPCLAFNKCDPGLFCASAETVPGCVEASGCCSELCDLSAPDPDAACSGQEQGQQCIPWYEQDPPPGAEDLGACAVPG